MRKLIFLCLVPIFIYSCNLYKKPDVFEIPYGYEGYVCVVFGVEPPKGVKFKKMDKFNLLKIEYPPYKFLASPPPENPESYLFLFCDNTSYRDIGLNDTLDPSFDRIFFGEFDSITIRNKSYKYLSALITKDFHQPEDSTVLNQRKDKTLIHKELVDQLNKN